MMNAADMTWLPAYALRAGDRVLAIEYLAEGTVIGRGAHGNVRVRWDDGRESWAMTEALRVLGEER